MLFSSFSVFIADRIIKYLITENLHFGQVIDLVPEFINLTYVRNTGIALGLLSDLSKYAIIAVNIIILSLCAVFFIKLKNKSLTNCFYFIFFGALSNIIDRILYGHVVDYINLKIMYQFPTFNLGDCMIVFSVIVLTVIVMKNDLFSDSQNNEK